MNKSITLLFFTTFLSCVNLLHADKAIVGKTVYSCYKTEGYYTSSYSEGTKLTESGTIIRSMSAESVSVNTGLLTFGGSNDAANLQIYNDVSADKYELSTKRTISAPTSLTNLQYGGVTQTYVNWMDLKTNQAAIPIGAFGVSTSAKKTKPMSLSWSVCEK